LKALLDTIRFSRFSKLKETGTIYRDTRDAGDRAKSRLRVFVV
jgi:hypothetical protein